MAFTGFIENNICFPIFGAERDSLIDFVVEKMKEASNYLNDEHRELYNDTISIISTIREYDEKLKDNPLLKLDGENLPQPFITPEGCMRIAQCVDWVVDFAKIYSNREYAFSALKVAQYLRDLLVVNNTLVELNKCPECNELIDRINEIRKNDKKDTALTLGAYTCHLMFNVTVIAAFIFGLVYLMFQGVFLEMFIVTWFVALFCKATEKFLIYMGE